MQILRKMLTVIVVTLVTLVIAGTSGYLYSYFTVMSMIADKDAVIQELSNEITTMNSTIQNLQVKVSDLQAELDLQKAKNISTVVETLKGYGNVSIINMTAEQFAFVPHKVEIKQGIIVVLRVWSTSDLEPQWKDHGIMIEGYGINEITPTDQIVTIIFLADRVGTFGIHCSVYCGSGHDDMHGQLIVQSA